MRVPEYKQPTVDPKALPNVPQNVNYTSDANGGQVAGAVGQAGRAVGDVAARWQAEDDEAAVKAAGTAFNDELRVLMHDPQRGFYAQRGSNAMNAYGGLDAQIQALREKHGKGLANTKQQQMFG